MEQIDLAYLAGFFDGEGSVYIGTYTPVKDGKRYSRLVAKLYQADPDVIQWVQSEFGGSIERRTKNISPHSGLPAKDIYCLALSHRTAYKFLTAIQPYLRVKRDKVNECLRLTNQNAEKNSAERDVME